MKPKLRMQIVADATVPAGRFHALIILEDTWTGDGRLFTAGSLSWRDLPFPLMAKDTDEHGSFSADTKSFLVGNFDTIERQGTELHGWGDFIAPDLESENGREQARLIGMIQRGELHGISADIDEIEFEVLFPVDPEDDEEGETVEDEITVYDDPADEFPREEVDGQEYIVIEERMPRMRVTEGRVMGATAVPFPALQEAYLEGDGGEPESENVTAPALAASAARTFAHHGVTGVVLQTGDHVVTPGLTAGAKAASKVVRANEQTGRTVRENPAQHFSFPAIPPAEWFEVPETPGPMPLTITNEGQVFGHVAVWGECHVGFANECVEPPQSASNYARFHTGECPTDDGGRVAVGHLTFGTGHADPHLNAMATRAHYDDTGTVGADIVAMDGEHGIWVCGAARSTLTDAQVREVMSAPPSGDWRRFGQHLEMVGVLCVNVPGFNDAPSRHSAKVRREDGLVASLIVSNPARPLVAASTYDMAARRLALRSINRIKRARHAAAVAALDARIQKVRN